MSRRTEFLRKGMVGAAIALGALLIVPDASAHGGHGRGGRHPGHRPAHGPHRVIQRHAPAWPGPHAVRVAPEFRRPVRVVYLGPWRARRTFVLTSPRVVLHGPRFAPRVVAYPPAAPVLYAPGTCPAHVHYHPYVPEPGVHGSVRVTIGF